LLKILQGWLPSTTLRFDVLQNLSEKINRACYNYDIIRSTNGTHIGMRE